MAHTLHAQGMDEIVREMNALAANGKALGDVTEAMIEAGAEAAKAVWKQVAEARRLRDTGDMIDSIGSAAPNKRETGAVYRDIYPLGKDRYGTSNAMKAYLLHYGTSRIKATYWVDEVEARVVEPLHDAMAAVWDDWKVGNLT